MRKIVVKFGGIVLWSSVVSVLSFYALYACYAGWLYYTHDANIHWETTPYSKDSQTIDKLPDGLAKSIIELEMAHNLHTEQEGAAIHVLSSWFEEVQAIKPASQDRAGMLAYMKQVHHALNSRFNYTASTDLIDGLATQTLDCDLRTILVIDAAAEQGISLRYVPSPRHAFAAWSNNDGMDIYWETTSSSFAQVSARHFDDIPDATSDYYLKPLSDNRILSYFEGLIYRQRASSDELTEAEKAQAQQALYALADTHADDPYLQIWALKLKIEEEKKKEKDASGEALLTWYQAIFDFWPSNTEAIFVLATNTDDEAQKKVYLEHLDTKYMDPDNAGFFAELSPHISFAHAVGYSLSYYGWNRANPTKSGDFYEQYRFLTAASFLIGLACLAFLLVRTYLPPKKKPLE
ncbi:hypothetical protein K0504_10005 [Neiella marina]|uniref:Uncharacterized protein n=1 Tax=Neiella holothuriorum TaxID=2870530 RepID=A0ABS7EGA8_9GAMM|nr:hypothetical protein [Neiella holothuriorum]MBW8191371.1 hypothetical protein [Neiella holothuriorum]